MPTFSATEIQVRGVIREVSVDMDINDPAAIIEAVVDRIPPHLLREALRQALPPLIRDVLTEHRPRGPLARPLPSRSGGGAQRRLVGGGAPSPHLSGSRKGSEIRDAWQKVLEAPYSTASGHKRLGDCGYDDLQYMAKQLDVLAERNARRARGFREMAALLTDHSAPTVRNLPAEVLVQALGASS